MSEELVYKNDPVLLVGGGESKISDFAAVQHRCVRIIAADGGADTALAAGVVPDLVFGDMDSISVNARTMLPRQAIRLVKEQSTSDFEKCLSRISAPLIHAIGFLGHRVDHQLAAMSVLSQYHDRRCILLGAHDVVAHVPLTLTLDLPVDTRVSLFPMARVHGKSTGLFWPIDGLRLEPAGMIATSNRATGPVHLSMTPGCLIILPRSGLDILAAALTARG